MSPSETGQRYCLLIGDYSCDNARSHNKYRRRTPILSNMKRCIWPYEVRGIRGGENGIWLGVCAKETRRPGAWRYMFHLRRQ